MRANVSVEEFAAEYLRVFSVDGDLSTALAEVKAPRARLRFARGWIRWEWKVQRWGGKKVHRLPKGWALKIKAGVKIKKDSRNPYMIPISLSWNVETPRVKSLRRKWRVWTGLYSLKPWYPCSGAVVAGEVRAFMARGEIRAAMGVVQDLAETLLRPRARQVQALSRAGSAYCVSCGKVVNRKVHTREHTVRPAKYLSIGRRK